MTWRRQKIGLGLIVVSLLLVGAACDSTATYDNTSSTTQPESVAPVTTYSITAPAAENTSVTSPAPNGYYENSYGNEVPRPYSAPSVPAGASAQCADGTYSFSQHRQGTCSHHGGVDTWY